MRKVIEEKMFQISKIHCDKNIIDMMTKVMKRKIGTMHEEHWLGSY